MYNQKLSIENLQYRIKQLENVLQEVGEKIENSPSIDNKEELIRIIQKGIAFNQYNLGENNE
jgi:hypothetical protein